MNTRILPKGTLIYRSYTDDSDREGFWFSLEKADTYGYGLRTAEFKLSRDLVLADITSPSFYELLKGWLKDATAHDINLKREHAVILFPLGFDDVVFYKEYAKLSGIDVDSYPMNPIVHTESMLYFGNRSRLSIKQFDIKLMEFLKPVIGHLCDGICSLNHFPDIIRNGMHHPELSVFDNTSVQYVQDVPRPVIGGATKADWMPPVLSAMNVDNEFVRNSVKRLDETLKNLHKFDVQADIKIITHPLDIKQEKPNTSSLKKHGKTRKRRL